MQWGLQYGRAGVEGPGVHELRDCVLAAERAPEGRRTEFFSNLCPDTAGGYLESRNRKAAESGWMHSMPEELPGTKGSDVVIVPDLFLISFSRRFSILTFTLPRLRPKHCVWFH